jgi:hypothetical protein
VAEYLLVQRLQPWSGLGAELVHRRGARRLIGTQRITLPAGSIEREELLLPEPLPQRVGRDQLIQPLDGLLVASEAEQAVDAPLLGGEPERVQPSGLPGQHRCVADILQRCSSPQAQTGLERSQCSSERVRRECSPRRLHRGGEPVDVDGLGSDLERIARRAGHQAISRGSERATQARHRHLERGGRVRRRVLRPHGLDQRAQRDHPVGAQDEHCERVPGVGTPDVSALPLHAQHERAEQIEGDRGRTLELRLLRVSSGWLGRHLADRSTAPRCRRRQCNRGRRSPLCVP